MQDLVPVPVTIHGFSARFRTSLAAFHRAQEHDVGAISERCVSLRQLAVDREGQLPARLDADGGEQVGERGALGKAVPLGPSAPRGRKRRRSAKKVTVTVMVPTSG